MERTRRNSLALGLAPIFLKRQHMTDQKNVRKPDEADRIPTAIIAVKYAGLPENTN